MPEAEGLGSCLCASLPDLAVVPMGGAGFDERVLATIESLCDHGGAQWWLHLARCSACGQHWMIAQEERIYDEHFLKRLSPTEVDAIQADRRWPEDFLTYARAGGGPRSRAPLHSSRSAFARARRHHRRSASRTPGDQG
ncbi:hypothetical protein AB2M62_07555 [Sphingomonas sp. MMS12-HWE2-04]|uniref:hypothetical protein n=1 Tax=Sphingomonas sp. MMS12-HWE2-04 TaxID=3234199 RepID=UPI003850FF51